MTKKNIKDINENIKEAPLGYGFYSNVLQKPFERLIDLEQAEAVYFAEQKAKEEKAAQKKAEAKKVEDAFKALNAARKSYKEKLSQLTQEYSDALTDLKKAFELGKQDIHNTLANAEATYDKVLKEFIAAHPEGYHLTLKDGDFETTLSSKTTTTETPKTTLDFGKLFDLLFGLN